MIQRSANRLDYQVAENAYLLQEYSVRNATLQGYGGRTNTQLGNRMNGVRRGAQSDQVNNGVYKTIGNGAVNMAVGSVETAGIRAGLVAAGVGTGPAGWIALGASLLLPKINLF